MKLNPDCVRDVMLVLEEITGINYDRIYRFIGVNCRSLSSRFKGVYDEGEIAYTLI